MRIFIRNITSHLKGELPEACLEELDEALSFQIPGGQFAIDGFEQKQRTKLAASQIAKKQHLFGRKLHQDEIDKIEQYWNTCELSYKWDGKKHLFNKNQNSIPTGLLRRTVDIIKEHGIEVEIIDKRVMPKKQFNWSLHGLELYPDQQQVVDAAIKKQRGLIQAATGWGKTAAITGLVAGLGRKTLILIHRDSIFQQLYTRIGRALKAPVMGAIKGNIAQPNLVTIAMIQSVSKPQYAKFLKTIDVVIVDEVHHVAADQYVSVMNGCTEAFFRYGFSATPFRENSDMLEIEAHTAGFICKISPSELIAQGRLARPFIYFLNNPPLTQFENLSWQKQYDYCIVRNDQRNSMFCLCVAELWKAKKTCLMAVTHIKHGKILLKMLKMEYPLMRVKFIDGSNESHEKQLALKELNEHKLDVVIATTVFGEGVDVPNLDAICNLKGNASKIEIIQLIGRALRVTEKKKVAFYIDAFDGEHYTTRHSKDRINILKKEKEFKIKPLMSVEEFKIQLEEDLL